ncbi:MAG: type II toxin-antitoxin system VapC family toxin [Pirellulaceae bacterium]|nr:type II toxin-antitoxin system VapC family toxin [Planctomycetales bacterium]
METVYLETTVVGTIASRDHPDPIMLARQLSTRQWWSDAGSRFDLRISDLVIAECSAGDPTAASERLQVVAGIDILAPTDDAESLAEALMAGKAVPESEPRDAAHIALAAVHGMNYLVTWNFKHILNPHLQRRINEICRESGFIPPTICTPEQLLESYDDI